MNYIKIISVLFFISYYQLYSQQVTGLSGWNIYLDPGHSQFENMGAYGYSEAEKVLRVGLNLRQMLLDWTDIDTVYICREDDFVYVTLAQRTSQANALAAAHYHSIHSDASSSPEPNSTLLLWGQLGINGPEKFPPGGKKMSDIMIVLLTAGYRTTSRGSVGDRTFYNVPGSTPYLWVNRETNMPSQLSEAGFHTNPTQNQLNMNAKWKRLEALTFYWSILKYHNIPRPFAGTVAGIIRDFESNKAINGAVISILGQIDTTDTWEKLFHKYSNDPELLRNGFYYFEGLPPGTHQIKYWGPNYDTLVTTVTMRDTFITFKDVTLISNRPPTVASTVPANNDSLYPGNDPVIINFTRQMDRNSVQNALQITPNVSYTLSWSNNDQRLTITTNNFTFNTLYRITILGTALGKFGHQFDGNGDGIPGDPYIFNVRTKAPDTTPPSVVSIYPSANSTNVELRPIISFAFNEQLNTATLSGKFNLIRNSTNTNANGILRHYVVNNRSVINFFVTTPLIENETYTMNLQAGVEDLFGNVTTSPTNYTFTTGVNTYNQVNLIDNFENGIGNWLQPTGSGSTIGVIPTQTNAALSTTVINVNTASTRSMQLNYAWETSASSWLLRQFFNPTTPTFGTDVLLQAFIFGDGSNNKFRFCVNDNGPGGHEVSPWYNIDWIGWKLVNWNLSQGQTGNWIGNNILEPPLSFDSFQLTYTQGTGNVSGTIYFDDLRTATFSPVGVEQESNLVPSVFLLEQNYPNPFNPTTTIRFSIAEETHTKIIVSDILGRELKTLLNDNLSAGTYKIDFDASDLPSGIYLYTIITEKFNQTKKMVLIK
jgi:N-acetylmuramoyl-L-alanine amidase